MADLHPDFYKSLGGGFSDIFVGIITPIYLGELGEDSSPILTFAYLSIGWFNHQGALARLKTIKAPSSLLSTWEVREATTGTFSEARIWTWISCFSVKRDRFKMQGSSSKPTFFRWKFVKFLRGPESLAHYMFVDLCGRPHASNSHLSNWGHWGHRGPQNFVPKKFMDQTVCGHVKHS